jgi:hypothetical protein
VYNKYPATCIACGKRVPSREGIVIRATDESIADGGSVWKIHHIDCSLFGAWISIQVCASLGMVVRLVCAHVILARRFIVAKNKRKKMTEQTVCYSPGAVIPIDPQVAYQALTDIQAKHDTITAKLVVSESRPEVAPLHPVFEWEDSVAGELYREHQARYVIRSVRIIENENQGPAFVNVVFPKFKDGNPSSAYEIKVVEKGGSLDNRGYLMTSTAMADTNLRQQVLEDALRGIRSWRKRYSALTELSSIFAAIDQMVLVPTTEETKSQE